jgi:putative phage-type endonuclease
MSLSPEQLAMRRTGLTASDIVVLSGTVPFKKTKTVYDVFLDKVHPDKVAPTEVTEAMELGHEVEPAIVAHVARKKNLCVVYPHTTVRHKEIEWALATPDALIATSTDRVGIQQSTNTILQEQAVLSGLVEAKLVGLHVADCWGETEDVEHGPPDYVYTQVVWQLFVTGYRYCIVAAMIGTEFRMYHVNFDASAQEYAAALVDVGEKFLVDHVRPQRPPPVDGSQSSREMLATLFRKSSGVTLKADQSDEEAARAYFKGKKVRDDGQWLMDGAKTALMAKIQDNYGLRGDGWTATWGEQNGYHVEAYDVAAMRKFSLRPRKR